VAGEAPAGTTARTVGPWRAPSGAAADEAAEDAAAETAAPSDVGGVGTWASLVLVCAHKLRDKRCDVAAPLIMEELRAECAKHGLGDQVGRAAVMYMGGGVHRGGEFSGVWGLGNAKHVPVATHPANAAAAIDMHSRIRAPTRLSRSRSWAAPTLAGTSLPAT
jgi:hypothetical protein